MPRQARLDIPGTLHHVMGRGIERQQIFRSHERVLGGIGLVESLVQGPKSQKKRKERFQKNGIWRRWLKKFALWKGLRKWG